MRIIFSILLLFSLTLPLFEVKNNSSTDRAIDYLKDKILDSNWGSVANQVINLSEKVLKEKEEKENEKGLASRLKQSITTGYGVGYSSVGAFVISWNNFRFGRFDIVPIIPLIMILVIILQVTFHPFFYRNRNAILLIVNMLLSLSVFGNCIGHDNYSGHLIGIVIFILIQISYMIYFYWFPYKEITVVKNENQES